MGKSKVKAGTVVSPPQNKLALALKATTSLGVDATLSKDDIIAIAVSREEISLKKQAAALDSELRALNKTVEEQCQKKRTMLADFVKSKEEPAKALVTSLAKFGCEVELTATANMRSDKLDVVLRLDGIAGRLNFSMPFDIPKNIAAIEADMKELDKDIGLLKEQIIKVRMSLADLPTMERQARAAIAEAALSSSVEGRALLDTLGDVKPLRQIV